VIYFEHCLREAGIQFVASVSVLRSPGAERIASELGDEIRDVLPAVHVREVATDDPPAPCELLIAIFSDPYRFPLQDVIYERLSASDSLLRHAQQARHVMLYRTSWRTAEIVPAARLRAHLRRLRLEDRFVKLVSRSRVLRRLLQPRYGQGN